MVVGPGDGIAAAEGQRRGELRASHADRERVIEVLKAAFVRGRLAKDEFDPRLGQALAARTYAELAAATADLPAMPIAAEPPKPAPAQGEPRIPRPGIVLTVATVVYAAVWPVVFLLPKDGEGDPQGGLALVMLASFSYLILLLLIGTPILADWLNERW